MADNAKKLIPLDDICSSSNKFKIVESLDSIPDSECNPNVVLCTIEGPLSDFSVGTRNDRWYTKELWEKVFASEEFKELLETKTLFGEADHPMEIEDRSEVHYDNVSHAVRDPYIDNENNCVMGKVDILDTPSGRILYTFVKYGSILGVSSRGTGDLIERNGRIEVDPDTYTFYAWDIVHMPSNKKARLKKSGSTVVNESKDSSNQIPYKVIMKLVESVKSEKSTLSSLKNWVEDGDIEDKDNVVKKINEYVDMLSGDNCQDNIVPANSTFNFLMKQNAAYKEDIKNLLNKIGELNAKIAELTINSNSPKEESNSNAKDLDSVIRSLTLLESNNLESNKKQDKLLSCFCDLSNEVMDRIDEAYEGLIKPLSKIYDFTNNSSDDFIIGRIDKLIDNKLSAWDRDKHNEVVKLQDELKSKDQELKSKNSEIDKLTESFKSIRSTSLEDKKKYLFARCSLLGLNPNLMISKIPGNLSDCTFDDIDETLKEEYSMNQSDGKAEQPLTENVRFKKSDNKINESKNNSNDYSSLFDLIRNNK